MTIASHIQALKRKHTSLSAAVEKAQQQAGSDSVQISDLKKKKLRLKEEIGRLNRV
jgi:hypothetical protein